MTDKILDRVDKALDANPGAGSIYVHKDAYKAMNEDCDARSHGAIEGCNPATTPVVEGPLGSTKQLGRYAAPGRDARPVYSHGKDPGAIWVSKDAKGPAVPA